MKILIFSHSGNFGGAENALRYLVKILSKNHEVHVVLPKIDGTEAIYYSSIGVKCFHLNQGFALPNFSTAIFNYFNFCWFFSRSPFYIITFINYRFFFLFFY